MKGSRILLSVLVVLILPISMHPANADATFPPAVVIAVIDSGTNFYHREFRDEHGGAREPASFIASYPDDARAIALSLDAPDWSSALEQDRAVLRSIEPGRLYWFPGTKIVGAMSFDFYRDGRWPLILDEPGVSTHGSMTTSRAAGNTISLAGPEIRLVVLQATTNDGRAQALTWAAFEPWIDMISVSFSGPPAGLPATPSSHAALSNALSTAAAMKPTFASAGNGLGNLGTVGFPVWLRGMSGLPNVISVGAIDNEFVAQWSNLDPYVAGDGCRVFDIDPGSMDGIVSAGAGTSAATPWVAGGAARIVLAARQALADAGPGLELADPAPGWDSGLASDQTIALATGDPRPGAGPLSDGILTLAELKRSLYFSALSEPTVEPADGGRCDVPPDATWLEVATVPAGGRFPLIGFGEVNSGSVARATEWVLEGVDLPDRTVDEVHYRRAHALKSAFART